MNEVDMFVMPATHPIRNVPTAPPSGVIMRKEEAILVADAHPLIVIANIVGNMMASKA